MKNRITRILCMALVLVLCVGLIPACTTPEDDTIWVGNTAGTTGALAEIGVPFNLGIEAAFAEYNKNGGFNGRNVGLPFLLKCAGGITLQATVMHFRV